MQVLDQLAASGRSDQQVPVIIEHVEPAEVIGEDDQHAQVSELAQQLRKLQEGIVQRLRDLGVHSAPQQMVLVYEAACIRFSEARC